MTDTSFQDFLNSIPVRAPRKPKIKKVFTSKYNLKQLYYDSRRAMFQREYPAAWVIGEYYDNDFPKIDTTNGTQNYIQDVLNNFGHHAERINTMGIPGKDGKWRRSGSTKGSSDLHCEIKIPSQVLPVGWKIEVKNKDTMLKAQVKYQKKMNRVGVLHTIIHVGNLDLFWDEYYRIINL